MRRCYKGILICLAADRPEQETFTTPTDAKARSQERAKRGREALRTRLERAWLGVSNKFRAWTLQEIASRPEAQIMERRLSPGPLRGLIDIELRAYGKFTARICLRGYRGWREWWKALPAELFVRTSLRMARQQCRAALRSRQRGKCGRTVQRNPAQAGRQISRRRARCEPR